MKPVSVEDLERVARLYKSNKEASAALGIHPRSFARLCRQHGISTPYVRRRNARQASLAVSDRPTLLPE